MPVKMGYTYTYIRVYYLGYLPGKIASNGLLVYVKTTCYCIHDNQDTRTTMYRYVVRLGQATSRLD